MWGVAVTRANWWVSRGDLAALFLFHGMAMAAWYVPLSPVLEAEGLTAIRPLAFATSAVAALISPLIFGAFADRSSSPRRVLGWLATAAVGLTVAATWAIREHRPEWGVLALIQAHALVAVPSWSLLYTVALERVTDARREFGPIRAVGTLGWMAGCWVISGLQADDSTTAGWVSAGLWLGVVALAFGRSASPGQARSGARAKPAGGGGLSVRQRLGLDALALLRHADHRAVFLTAGLIAIPLSAFYPFTPLHLRDLGLVRTSAWMSLGQVTEIVAMFGLAALLARWRLKWIFACGMGFALVRYGLCAMDGLSWVLAGVTLHGFAFTLFFITAPIYLNEQVETEWRARAQALMSLMTMGAGNLVGYLGGGWWYRYCTRDGVVQWSWFWGALAGSILLVLLYFAGAFRGRRGDAERPPAASS